MAFYHAGNRALQDIFASTALADRLAERTMHTTFTDDDKIFIENARFFFLATAAPDGRPDCSFKGGAPGFAKVISPDLLVFPDYDGNGMFRSLGNIRANPFVGLLFIQLDEKPKRLRVNGRAEFALDDPLIADFAGAQGIVRVTPEHIFPNCPRYIPNEKTGDLSPFTPIAGVAPTEPTWKSSDSFKDVVPPRRR